MAVSTLPKAADTAAGVSPEQAWRLARFIAILMLDRGRLGDFLADAEAEMDQAGLTERQRGHLRDQGFLNICDYQWEAGQGPAPDPETGGGP